MLKTIRMIAICALALATASPTIASESLAADGKKVERMIAHYFPEEYKTMVAIAACESTGLAHREADGTLIQNEGGGSARGVFQVLMRVHGPEMKRMGLDPNNDDDYMTYVRHLKEVYGLTPWAESKKCWKRKLPA